MHKDKKGHFTDKANDGGECRHGSNGGHGAWLKGPAAYREWVKGNNPDAKDEDIDADYYSLNGEDVGAGEAFDEEGDGGLSLGDEWDKALKGAKTQEERDAINDEYQKKADDLEASWDKNDVSYENIMGIVEKIPSLSKYAKHVTDAIKDKFNLTDEEADEAFKGSIKAIAEKMKAKGSKPYEHPGDYIKDVLDIVSNPDAKLGDLNYLKGDGSIEHESMDDSFASALKKYGNNPDAIYAYMSADEWDGVSQDDLQKYIKGKTDAIRADKWSKAPRNEALESSFADSYKKHGGNVDEIYDDLLFDQITSHAQGTTPEELLDYVKYKVGTMGKDAPAAAAKEATTEAPKAQTADSLQKSIADIAVEWSKKSGAAKSDDERKAIEGEYKPKFDELTKAWMEALAKGAK